MRLRRSDIHSPGLGRRRRGENFTYHDAQGARITDEATVKRLRALVIPPAWQKVWISPHPNDHIQAVGTDAAGRRQYLYHEVWQQERAEEKFDRVLEMAPLLPQFRRQIGADLDGTGLKRNRVLALALLLLDRGYFRAGSDQYAQENESYGLATLLCEHVTVRGNTVHFDYPGKSGVRRTHQIDEPLIVRLVRSLTRGRGSDGRLLVCRNGSDLLEVHADDLNVRFKELVGDDYSVKDLRTWHGTVLAAAGFAGAEPPSTKTAAKRARSAVMKQVAAELGNTPAVARGSYVDPRVVRAYEKEMTISAAVHRAAGITDPDAAQAVLEKATRGLIRRMDRI